MSMNILNDISAVYLQQIAEKKDDSKEALDPVGQEDDDPDNDGIPNDNNDKYILKRRKAIGKAISKKKSVKESNYYDPMDDDEFDHDEAEENRGVSGKNNPKGGKSLIKKKKSVKEGFSNWRQDLSEVMDDIEANKQIKEKKVNNKIKINPEMKEAVEELGGELIEMVEIDEGMTMKAFKQQRSRQKQKEKRSSLKTSPTRRAGIHNPEKSPERAARHRANVDPDFEGNDERNYPGGKLRPKKVRKAKALGELGEEVLDEKAYRGLGVGRVERVSSGSYKAPETTGSAAKRKSKPVETKPVETKRPAALPPEQGRRARKRRAGSPSYDQVKAQIDAKEKSRKSRKPRRPGRNALDKLLASIRNEDFQLNEKATSEQQQKLFGLALSVKRGQTPRSQASDEVLKIVDGMSEKKIRDFAKTKHEGLPKKVKEEIETIDERMHDEPGEGPRQRYGDYHGRDRSGSRGIRMSAGLQPREMIDKKTEKKKVAEQMDDQIEPTGDKKMEQQRQKIQMQKVRDLTTRLQAARKGVY